MFPLTEAYSQESAISATITLQPDSVFQTIVGWEAVAWVGQDDHPKTFSLWNEEVLDLAAYELGINRLRVEIYSGYENPVDYFSAYLKGEITYSEWEKHRFEIINDDIDPYTINPAGFQFSRLDFWIDNVVLPLRQRLHNMGEDLFINLCYVDFGASDFEHKDFPLDYAEFVLATYMHLQEKYGWTPDAWEVILEPDMPAAGWSPIQIADAMRLTANRLEEHGFTPAFIAPSCTSVKNAITYFDKIIPFPVTQNYLFEFSYQLYRYANNENRKAIGERAVRYGVRTSQLEKIGATYHDLHEDLKLARVSSWEQYTISHPINDNGAQYYWIDTSDSVKPVVRTGIRTYYLQQYFKYVRRGARRIGAISSHLDCDPIAFINPNGKYVVIVRSFTPATLTITGIPPGIYGIRYTVHKQAGVNLPEVIIQKDEKLKATIPKAGVITFFRK